jgi:hypothetical protein
MVWLVWLGMVWLGMVWLGMRLPHEVFPLRRLHCRHRRRRRGAALPLEILRGGG